MPGIVRCLGITTAASVIVNTQPPCSSPLTKSPDGTPAIDRSSIARLASLVEDVVDRLETPVETAPSAAMVLACNAALESCLEALRDAGDRDTLARTAREDLTRLYRLLKLVDGADVPFVLRQIRRVLGRFDARGRSRPVEPGGPSGPSGSSGKR
ncbi:MAG TPA: hypothetical protein VFT22_05285 [Kofleriaceae bacterium]|nr:hypothetical protein [Kofleriaceae bacterium]